MKRALFAATAAGGAFLMLAAATPASALPLAKSQIPATAGIVHQTAPGHGGGGGGGFGRGMGGGGGHGMMGGRPGGGGRGMMGGGHPGGGRGMMRGGPGPSRGIGGGRGHGGPRMHPGPRGPRHAGPGHHHGHHHHHHRRGYRGFYYGGFPSYYYGYGGYDDCGWLRRRALVTGSPYWWDRYYACIGD